jgi:aspartyl-tRNA synthetase
LSKVFCEAPAPEDLGQSLATANKATTGLDDEEAVDGIESLTVKESAVPGASLATHISNPVMHKRAPVAQAISDVRMTVRKLFAEYLDARGFHQFEPPCLIGAASEGGAEVFTLPYFGKKAYLAQSAQFYKQIELQAGERRCTALVRVLGPRIRTPGVI